MRKLRSSIFYLWMQLKKAFGLYHKVYAFFMSIKKILTNHTDGVKIHRFGNLMLKGRLGNK